MKKLFGTDGVRGIANTELTPALAFNLAKAGGYVINKYSHHDGRKPIAIIGTDTRISKDMLKTSLMAGFMSTGINIIDCGIIPTPAIAYLTRHFKADIGAVISASHNPMEYNGIKFFNSQGLKLADSIEEEIEDLMDKMQSGEFTPEVMTHNQIGRLIRSENPKQVYMQFLLDSFDLNLKGLKVALDTANGASYSIAPQVYKELKANVSVTANKPNGININWECGSTHVDNLQKFVLEQKADIGLAYDGDADRLIAVDEKGKVVDGDQIMMIIANYLKNKKLLKDNKLVVTVMSNLGLKIAAKKNNIDLSITNVGDRYVLEEMLDKGYTIGGEQSGHIILLDYNTTGDGILSSLMLCKILKESGKKFSELTKIMTVLPQVLVNVKVKDEFKTTYKDIPEISEKIKEIENQLGESGRVLIRPSGTEPLIRVMIEGENEDDIGVMANDLANLIGEHCKK
ncbi:phosphoglucosamine mutase [Criibacterium bergeronii]|uniref:Phosphoglucosamine mutase n=1 Tax=Criibacterium bergeronii TaxID=1871336 RepID=A0A371IJT3_9FIRM|nr:phosphoglucosamine mutase [Criibacterium bergeronii]MBS6063796.1 phosphoglucosamine mutase [Peptostreptococcaceae bacterium]RDY20757.1 phosphoglucosamine mutase [Criibacterium bergeronii]